ncbi:MAG: HypC/HybG/HupF family hydrogenase formation chaperone [Coriobacteriia bacterium]|nr:HypC/HybG/HupF family hydrogenase formation chaperone [Coriobacteriia bacterium]MBS5478069.1 HypC/HybG/HupF family hydrogenase formation chaperone [Coriobacteriia bacterium]
MCLAVPSKVISVNEGGIALVDIMGVQRECSLMLTPDAKPGDFVLVHAGYAIQRIEEQDAAETLRLLGEIPDLLGDEFADEIAQASGTHEQGGAQGKAVAATEPALA